MSDEELRKYLSKTTTPLVQEFIDAVIEAKPDDVPAFMRDFAAKRTDQRNPHKVTRSRQEAEEAFEPSESSSSDTESHILGSSIVSPRVASANKQDKNELRRSRSTASCTRCRRLEEIVIGLRMHFMSVAYENLRLSRVPPWMLDDAVMKARQRTVSHCHSLCCMLEGASSNGCSSPPMQPAEPDAGVAWLTTLHEKHIKVTRCRKPRGDMGGDKIFCKPRGHSSRNLKPGVRTPFTDTSTSSSLSSGNSEVESLPDVMEQNYPLRWRAQARPSVCADSQSVVDQHRLPKYKKTVEEKERLRACLEKCFIWACVSKAEADLQAVIDSMKPVTINAGTILMRQGDTGDGMYFLDEGVMSVHRERKGGADKHLRDVGSGEVVGELAVLYQTTRSSTVSAKTSCTLWFWDRQSFTYLIRGAAKAKRDRFDLFLKGIPLLSSLGLYSRGRLADVLEEETFDAKSVIIRQGDPVADKCFIVYEGVAYAKRSAPAEAENNIEGKTEGLESSQKSMIRYHKGDIFGECAILYNTARLATVTAETFVKLLVIPRRAFRRVFSDIKDELIQSCCSQYSDLMTMPQVP